VTLTAEERDALKQQVVACLRNEPEVRRIVLFGSFVASASPQDVDVAVFQESEEGYLSLALKYRRLLRPVANRIPVDVIRCVPRTPLAPSCTKSSRARWSMSAEARQWLAYARENRQVTALSWE